MSNATHPTTPEQQHALLPAAARLAVEVAITTSGTSAVLNRTSSLPGVAIQAVGFGPMIVEQEGSDGEVIRINQTDARSLIVWPHDLVDADGELAEPQSGDKWEVILPTGKCINCICVQMDSTPPWRWTDRFETAYRIYVKVR